MCYQNKKYEWTELRIHHNAFFPLRMIYRHTTYCALLPYKLKFIAKIRDRNQASEAWKA